MDGGTLATAETTALEKLQSSKDNINAPSAIRTTMFLRKGYTYFVPEFIVNNLFLLCNFYF